MTIREGSLEAPTRHPLDWKSPNFHDEAKLEKELERVFDICQGCRRCVNLCTAFPTLFDLVDGSPDPTRAVIGLRNHGVTITGPNLADILERTEGRIIPRVPMS